MSRNEAGAHAISLPTPAERQPKGIHAFTWSLWPWMTWLLPIFLVTHGLFIDGGWATLALIMFSPIIVPVAGLLGALPRFILRRRGHRTAPGPVPVLLFLHWWSWVTATMTIGADGGSGSAPSLLRDVIPVALSTRFESTMYLVAAVVVVASWVALIFLAGLTAPRPQQNRSWSILTWIAAFVVPALLITVVLFGVMRTAERVDAAGDTSAQAQALPIEMQAERAEERFAQEQDVLSEVRRLIAAEGWELDRSGFADDPPTCRADDMECYAFTIGYRVDQDEPLDTESIRSALADRGWAISDGAMLEVTDADGRVLRIIQSEPGVRVELTSPFWWGDTFDIADALGMYDDIDDVDLDETYAFDEWLPLV